MKRSRYRAGPWPGVTPSGAAVLLACAAFLAIGQALIGTPEKPLPDVSVVGVTALLPMALALRIVQVPGAASAVCGAYLLPRSVIALLQTQLDQPPLLLVPAIVFDIALFVLASREPRVRPAPRALLAGAAFGAILAALEPAFRIFLGADPMTWSGPVIWAAIAATAVACAATATVVNARGTAS
jgi:hypothetical protein